MYITTSCHVQILKILNNLIFVKDIGLKRKDSVYELGLERKDSVYKIGIERKDSVYELGLERST